MLGALLSVLIHTLPGGFADGFAPPPPPPPPPPPSPERPTVCVEVQQIAALSGRRISEKELVQAVRARIARRQLHVERCRSASEAVPTWRLSAMPQGDGALLLVVTSAEERLGHVLQVGGMTSEQVIQLVALTAAEDVRPALDRLLQQLGIAEEDGLANGSAFDDLVSTVEEQAAAKGTAAPQQPAPPPTPPSAPSFLGPFVLDVAVGPLGGLFDLDLAIAAVVGASLGVGPLDVRLHLSGRPLPALEDVALSATGGAWSSGLALRWSDERLSLGAGLAGRLTQMDVVNRAAGTAKGAVSYWDVALSTDGKLSIHRHAFLDLALVFHADLWWQPRQLVVADRVIYRQPLLEVFVGPALGIVLPTP